MENVLLPTAEGADTGDPELETVVLSTPDVTAEAGTGMNATELGKLTLSTIK